MRKSLLCYFCIIIPTISVFAQSNYKDGYLITNGNDTIIGLIDFRTDHTNSIVCRFKTDEKSTEKEFNPGEIAGYRFINEGKYYVSRSVIIDGLKKTVFLEFLVQGLLNLYYLPTGDGYYFFENKDGEIISTTKKPDEITEDKKVKTDNRYKGVIAYILRDDLPLAVQTSKIGFDRRSMIEYTKEYHDDMCESGSKCIIFENDYKKKFTKFDFSTFSGLELNDIKLNNTNLPNMLSISPIVGFGVNISSPRLINTISLLFDGSLSKIAGSTDYVDGATNYYQYHFTGTKTNFCGGLEYVYPKGRIRPTVNAAFSYCYFFNLSSTLETHSHINKNEALIHNSTSGIKTGLGFDFQIKGNQFINLRLLYAYHRNYFETNDTYQLRLGYKF